MVQNNSGVTTTGWEILSVENNVKELLSAQLTDNNLPPIRGFDGILSSSALAR